MEIRFAENRDVPGILALLRQSGRSCREGRPDLFRAGIQGYSASQVLAMLQRSDGAVFVAAEADAVLGCGICVVKSYAYDSVMTEHTELRIEALCVAENVPEAGAAVYEAICRHARMRRCSRVTGRAWTCDAPAMAFYADMGMQPRLVELEQILEED